MKMIKSMLRLVARKLGYEIVPAKLLEPHFGWEVLMKLLLRHGFKPSHIVDVGANHGNWTRSVAAVFPECEFTMVEPQAALRDAMEGVMKSGIKARWVQAGASDEPGTLLLSSDGRDHSATFLPSAEEAQRAGMTQVETPVRTLNEIVATEGLRVPDLIKIDAEGLDLKVFRGASDFWGKTEVFLIEAVVCARDFPFQTSVLNVVRTLDEAGYELMDLTDLNRSPAHGLLWLVELAFVRKGSPLFRNCRTYLGD